MRFSGLSIRQLEAFDAFMQSGTVSGAATSLSISQPSVSRLLQDLEADCGLALFERRGGRLFPTHQATLFAQEVARTFQSARDLMTFAREIKELRRGTARIGTLAALSFDLVPTSLGQIGTDAASPSVVVTVNGSKTIAAMVAGQRLDVGLVDEGIARPGTHLAAIHEFNCVCVMDASHPLAQSQIVTLTDLAAHPFVTLDPDYLARTPDGAKLNAAVKGKVIAEAFQSFVACSFVRGNAALSVVDPFTARFYASHQLVFKPIDLRIPLRVALIQNGVSRTNLLANRCVETLDRSLADAR
ncbi:MAG: hypothetical protein DI629_08365 [Mesorhizobium amorphae]|nr:MAG: hypothetical protein DI629_08365 [Mesorhizobium amorphae]